MKLTKVIKNIQYKDTKFRLIQTINNMLLDNELVNINYYISSYTNSFLNIIINNINGHSVYISYTLRISDLQTDYSVTKVNNLIITKVNCIGKFDQGSIPELDNIFIPH